MDATASIAYLFKMDPVGVLEGGPQHFAIRHAAAKKIIAARLGVDIEELLDE